jgi:hypothetical protein
MDWTPLPDLLEARDEVGRGFLRIGRGGRRIG